VAESALPVEPFAARVDGVPMTGIRVQTANPRATVLALHGGGSRAAYFHGSVHPDQSLLRLAGSLGFTAVALEQPGYAASAGQVDGWSLERRADLVAATMSAVAGEPGAGIVVVGHSQGSHVATYLTARSADVIGLELSGTGLEMQDDHPLLVAPERPLSKRRGFERVWGDPALYPPGATDRENTRGTTFPADTVDDAVAWPRRLREIAARVEVPVQLSFAEHERVWKTEPEVQARMAAVFTRAPWVRTTTRHDAPHNISLALVARAYHLYVLAFAEECAQRAILRGRAATAAEGYARS
jgi:pimeloyl-ACP methyl ester carboxylesterase